MKPNSNRKCSESHCACSEPRGSGLARRDFLKVLGLGAGTAALQPWHAMAGPFTRKDFESLVPADKKLSREWLKSLTERGQRTVYRGASLEKIGMPVGGLCAGQLYLGGDGKLWHWDIFNRHNATGAEHYARPLSPSSPLRQGFALRIYHGDRVDDRPLDGAHWKSISFNGEYPIGYVQYRDPDFAALSVDLEAFSPFSPLNTPDSSLPATVMRFTVRNHSQSVVDAEIAGWLENAVCLHSSANQNGVRRNRLVKDVGCLRLECSARENPATNIADRDDILFDDFEDGTYAKWVSTGRAFGTAPAEIDKIPEYQGDLGGKGRRVVNSHASAPGNTVQEKDAAAGQLTSQPFTIARNYINFLIGGGAHEGRTCLNLVVKGRAVLSATGRNNNKMEPVTWDVRSWAGQEARLQIVDAYEGGWGNVGLDEIMFSDHPAQPVAPFASQEDFGTLALALLDPGKNDFGSAALPGEPLAGIFSDQSRGPKAVEKALSEKLVGSVGRKLKLAPGAAVEVVFAITWHMPNLHLKGLPLGRYYATRFKSARAVANYLAAHCESLTSVTRLWHDTWYDSTLPYWLLDRTFLNTSILASSTCHRLGNGRFYAWEGVGCCEGTCGHVWHYAHAPGRLFPDLERNVREQVDFGLAMQPDGAIHFRGEMNKIPAIDAQAGCILRALREHQMSADNKFLVRNWPQIKKATEWLIAKDENADGLIEGNQHNTLDTDWYGPVAWLSGLYLAALLAAEAMALESGDGEFAARCRKIFNVGQKNIVTRLFDGEYFINKPDSKHLDAINSGSGCHIDQVFGQSWAFQVGLPRVLPRDETLAALHALWRYNFTPDVGPYRDAYKPGRWYAMPGEAGLLMCTFPRDNWDYAQAKGKGPDWAAGYFNECMNGFEYQVAGHMIWEGMLTEGLAITRAVHDRYHPLRRNPWNEVECGDHYARSMASYGVFLGVCGFEYHGPRGHIGFAPRLAPEDFKAAFVAAEGWGSYSQKVQGGRQKSEIAMKWGRLHLNTFTSGVREGTHWTGIAVRVDGKPVAASVAFDKDRATVAFRKPLVLAAGQRLEINFI